MTTIGIDPSINSTGVCVISDNNLPVYYLIPSKLAKRNKENPHERITILPYVKEKADKLDPYHIKERCKINNMMKICGILSDILHTHQPQRAVIEGISYGSYGSAALADLAGLNFCMRSTVLASCPDCELIIASPMSVKMQAVGSGAAGKEVMIDGWASLDPPMKDLLDCGKKIDDLADAYFLANYRI